MKISIVHIFSVISKWSVVLKKINKKAKCIAFEKKAISFSRKLFLLQTHKQDIEKHVKSNIAKFLNPKVCRENDKHQTHTLGVLLFLYGSYIV